MAATLSPSSPPPPSQNVCLGPQPGVADKNVIGGVINSISRLIHLTACQTEKTLVLKDFKCIVGMLKAIKPVLDNAFNSELPSDEHLLKALEDLDNAVNQAREFTEKQYQKMSKIYAVLQSEPIVLKVQKSAVEICRLLNQLVESCPHTPKSATIQCCLQELQSAEKGLISELIKNALRDLQENTIPSLDEVIKIMGYLGLASNQELLVESIALEKEKVKAEQKEKMKEADQINEIIMLVIHFRHCIAKLEQFGFMNGAPIPAHFRCPLSLKIMLDPVILASGQTYERSFIQKWLDSGLTVCPKTHQPLAHTNLIPNYTVKELITSWCEDNNINHGDTTNNSHVKSTSLSGLSSQESRHMNDLHSPMHKFSPSNPCHDSPHQREIKQAEFVLNEEEASATNSQQLPMDKFILHEGIVEQKSCHSRTESTSSAISSIDISTKFDENVNLRRHPSCSALQQDLKAHPCFMPDKVLGSNIVLHNEQRSQSSLSSPKFEELTSSSHVLKLISDLKSQSPDLQTVAASDIRLLAKHNMENRILIAKHGAIPLLVSLLHSKTKKVQENAVTALLNLSINDRNKVLIAEAGAIEPLIYVLECGSSEAKENSAAALFSLSALEEYKVKIGQSGAIKALVNLLGSGSVRGKKDAATALFNLSIFHDNKARIVRAGAVKYLVELMEEPSTGMLDKSVALLANLSTVPEGRSAIVQEGGIPLLVEVVETGSQRGKENAASTLFQLCLGSQKFCNLVLQEGAVPPLIALSQFGTPRAKEKAQQILCHFRSQREVNVRKPKS